MSQTVTVVRVDTGQPFIARAEFVKNSDGSVSFGIDSGWAGQEPNQYGVRHDQHDGGSPQPYQRATLNGATVTFLTRPQDIPMVYLIGFGTAY